MTRYFLNQDCRENKKKPQDNCNESASKKLETHKRSKKKPSIKKSQSELEALVTVVKYKRKPWRGRNHEDDRLAAAKVQPPWTRKSKRVPVQDEKLARHSRGEGLSGDGIKTKFYQKKLKKHEADIQFSIEQAARAELLLPEESGFLVADEDELTTQFSQQQIASSVDIASATKHFDLHLAEFGPYRMNYSRNGRFLLIGGRRGHVAAIDWVTKRLLCEVNVMEAVYDVQWLHVETMFAVAQKQWLYIYDNQGIELHCIKRLSKVLRMEFLPYHFLLATASEEGFLSWLDISIGQMVSQFNTRMGRLNLMTHNPYNAVVCLGHSKGIVTMWSPNVKEPLSKMLCHQHPLQSLTVDSQGRYMATAAVDRTLKVWDVRKLEGPLQQYKLHAVASNLAFSQRGLLAVGMGNVVEVYRDCCQKSADRPYLRHRLFKRIGNMEYCPYEDVLGVATDNGFTSLIIPGSGEPNFDALECNPFQSKSQRREAEVKSLLEKIQPEFITLDPTVITDVHIPTLKDKVEAKKKLLFLKPPKIDFQPRNKSGKKKGTVKVAQTKRIVREGQRREFVKTLKETGIDKISSSQEVESCIASVKHKTFNALDRFKPKEKKQEKG
ncbi:WD repeat-containing protein 46 isoform X2 [Zootermopsis nevadensis]|uniref:WD repeat-containing protein 46 n=2 Tax=Zootermopsis nevadensis TaxID=136037 RepID=A0A067R6P0_ZOONE|nr:WD repeat-containing protein 46 isoform X2 [Zootermopsis nevadensis]KDR18018.1 WD repeat-containing protein 46 [Zootermopsis nevadensis]